MAFMVPLVKNHYDIYNRQASPLDHDGSLYLSATSLDSIKSAKAAAAAKKVARAKSSAESLSKSNNRKILIKVSTRPPAKSKSGSATGRVQSASISLPIARNEAGKPVLAIKKTTKPNSTKNGRDGKPNSEPLVTRPMPHIKRTLRNPYTNRVYSYSVSIPNYVAEEDEAALREYEKDDNEIESANGTPGNSLESVLLYSSSAPTSTSNLKERLNSDGNSTTSSEEEEFASNLSSPICPDSPTHESMAAGVMNCSATSLVYAYEAITAELNLPTTTPTAMINTSNKNKFKRSVSSPADTSGTDRQQQSQELNEKPALEKNQRSGNAREYIELLRKFIVHLKLLKLGSSKKLFTSSNKSSSNTNNNHGRSSSERRPRKDTMEDSNHL